MPPRAGMFQNSPLEAAELVWHREAQSRRDYLLAELSRRAPSRTANFTDCLAEAGVMKARGSTLTQ